MWINETCSRRNRIPRRLPAWALVAGIMSGSLLAGCGTADSSSDSDPAESAPRASEPTAVEPPEPATAADLFPDGPGRSLVLDNCGTCHAVACAAIGQRTPARWDNLKEGHQDHVPNLGEQDLETIFVYLKEHFNNTKPEPRVPPQFLVEGCAPF